VPEVPETAQVDAIKNTRAMLLSWFDHDELRVCAECGYRHVLPAWGSADGQFCATCGLLGLPSDRVREAPNGA
jgi:hypothetical protein